MIYLYLAIGGAAGTVARYLLGGWIQLAAGGTFPWGTLAVNVSGSMLLGFLARVLTAVSLSPEVRVLLTVGFCGAFTTFSTLTGEVLTLLQAGAYGRAAAYAVASFVLGVAAVAAGFALGAPLARG